MFFETLRNAALLVCFSAVVAGGYVWWSENYRWNQAKAQAHRLHEISRCGIAKSDFENYGETYRERVDDCVAGGYLSPSGIAGF